MGIIYRATCTVNGKVYVGQTANTLEHRAKQHFGSARYGSPYKFHKAIRKYGEDAFVFDVIEVVRDSELNEREMYWIKYYDSYESGYNSTLGGDSERKVDYDVVADLWGQGFSLREIANKIGCKKQTVTDALRGNGIYDHMEILHRTYKTSRYRQTDQYDMDGNYIQTFPSLKAAGEATGLNRSAISSCCSGGLLSYGGYQWRYHGDSPPGKYIDNQNGSRPVMQYSMTGEFIAEYNSSAEAAKALGISECGIIGCVNGRYRSSHGFQWKRKNDATEIGELDYHKDGRLVHQYTQDGVFVAEYRSLADAGRAVNRSYFSVRCVCVGKTKTCAGYVWKFADEEGVA